eukprot:6491642-Amphidinium_carterae.10
MMWAHGHVASHRPGPRKRLEPLDITTKDSGMSRECPEQPATHRTIGGSTQLCKQLISLEMKELRCERTLQRMGWKTMALVAPNLGSVTSNPLASEAGAHQAGAGVLHLRAEGATGWA